MSCLDCNTQNESSERLGKNCGMDTNHNKSVKNKENKSSDIFLGVFIICFIFFSFIIEFIDLIIRIDNLFGNDNNLLCFIVIIIKILSYLIWLLIPLSIKNKRLRITCLN